MSTRRRTTSVFLTAAALAAAAPFGVLAAGGGGGGGGAPTGMGNTVIETCTQDTWTCGEWGECGLNGQQTRACTKTFDCPNTESPPAPPAVASCTPECRADEWTCGAWGPCVSGRQRRICTKLTDCPIVDTPSPATDAACRLDCGNDVWSCTSWSACSPQGIRTRTCSQRSDCEPPEVVPAKPVERETCTPVRPTLPPPSERAVQSRTLDEKSPALDSIRPTQRLICGTLPTLAERVRCRLGLAPEVLERELQIQYLPEECRAIKEAVKAVEGVEAIKDAERCVERYRNLRPCWAKPIGDERLACVRGVLGLGGLREERARCDTEVGANQVQCLAELRQRAYSYITFRFYDLEERAEGLLKLGAPLDLVSSFVIAAEQGKIDFNGATSKTERIAIIRRVQSDWRSFVRDLTEQVKVRARTEGVGTSY